MARTWRRKYPFLYFRKGSVEGVFAPQWLCGACNVCYADHPNLRSEHPNTLFVPTDICVDGMQDKAMYEHSTSRGHLISKGSASSNAEVNIFQAIWFCGYFNIAAATHPFMIKWMMNHGGL